MTKFAVWPKTISVIESATAMQQLLETKPEDQMKVGRELCSRMAGIYRFIPGEVERTPVHRQRLRFNCEQWR
ncbi:MULTISPECIES: hypothetical protein [unclassified Arthrobacter]|uniref:hypothetical protein n=1 Tax=unclassified Arthrobacter TaxID=235627 RepID=UPI000CFCCF1F|nr:MULTISPECIES: hypothetical protein [unclassified Arthrobacter]